MGLGRPSIAQDRPRRSLEAPSSGQSRSRSPLKGLEGPTWDDSGALRGPSGAERCAWNIGRAESRSTFHKSGFFRFGVRFGVDFASPKVPLARALAPSGRSLGGLGRSWDTVVDPQGRPWVCLRVLLERFLALLGDTRAPSGSWDALRSDFGTSLERFGVDFRLFFRTIRRSNLLSQDGEFGE